MPVCVGTGVADVGTGVLLGGTTVVLGRGVLDTGGGWTEMMLAATSFSKSTFFPWLKSTSHRANEVCTLNEDRLFAGCAGALSASACEIGRAHV